MFLAVLGHNLTGYLFCYLEFRVGETKELFAVAGFWLCMHACVCVSFLVLFSLENQTNELSRHSLVWPVS